ncbi:DASH family cryptochrome [Flagellimonas aequoris]|uniref:DASH family cryptochrome n=1 Tax=Flagellimonas aequoris TaxID=2306997 RepID=UPI0016005C30|nr:DASH family cryptochrome [Allomuricauda aequoris]
MHNHLLWFGNNLRVRDNEALKRAMEGTKLIAVYFFDPRHFEIGPLGFVKTGRFRSKFLLEGLAQLKTDLHELNISLLTFFDKPESKIPELVKKHGVDTIFLQKEWTSEELGVIKNVKSNLPSSIRFDEVFDQFLFHPEDIPYTPFLNIPDVFTQFRKGCEHRVRVRPDLGIPKQMPKNNLIAASTTLPTMKDLSLDEFEPDPRSAFPFEGGEKNAHSRVEHYFWESKKLSYYKRTRNGLIGADYSSKLSPWLANGNISARTIYWAIKQFEAEFGETEDTYWLIFELIWRDYFKYISLKHGNKIFHLKGIKNRTYTWRQSPEILHQWIHGETKDTFVNANMKELEHTGWMSNRGRQNVASYWAKHLQQDWRWGASYFESMLLDYDVHSNWGNWMYNSGVGNDPRNRTFNTQRQAELYDPNNIFQNLWLQPTLF